MFLIIVELDYNNLTKILETLNNFLSISLNTFGRTFEGNSLVLVYNQWEGETCH